MTSKSEAYCRTCGHVWRVAWPGGLVTGCPMCHSFNRSLRAVEAEPPPLDSLYYARLCVDCGGLLGDDEGTLARDDWGNGAGERCDWCARLAKREPNDYSDSDERDDSDRARWEHDV
jgi:hypothetical protein